MLLLDEAEREDFAQDLRDLLELGEMFGDDKQVFNDRLMKQLRASVAEVYNPPRFTKAATALPELGVHPGSASTSQHATRMGSHGTSPSPIDGFRSSLTKKIPTCSWEVLCAWHSVHGSA